MKIDYGTMQSPFPISTMMGEIRKPKLREIAKKPMSYEKFYFFEFLITMTPKEFFTTLNEDGENMWNDLSDDIKANLNIFDILDNNKEIMEGFLEMLNFFFVETVLYSDGVFITLNPDKDYSAQTPEREDIIGVINNNNISDILSVIQQVCCISQEEPEPPKFKNRIAERLYKKMQAAEKVKKKKMDLNMTIPNIISAVSGKHHSLNYLNIYDLTLFQLMDVFGRLFENEVYDIEKRKVSVWGDEKNTFDIARWFKNNYDKSKPDS